MRVYLDANPSLRTVRNILEASEDRWSIYGGEATSDDLIVKYGINRSLYDSTYPYGARVLNRNIRLNKYIQNRGMFEHGVSVPGSWNQIERVERVLSEGTSVLVKKYISAGGAGIRFIESIDDAYRNVDTNVFYFQEFIDKEKEFRLMSVGDTYAFIMTKTKPENNPIAWNQSQGSVWSPVSGDDRDLIPNVAAIGTQALRAIGYDFGAVDVIVRGDKMYVLEVNSRPTLGPINSGRFVNTVERQFKEED